MIQLASDPAASRNGFRPAAHNEKGGSSSAPKRGRNGHAWPFLSRPVGASAPRESGKSSGDGGS
jgi:hypothetical protein